MWPTCFVAVAALAAPQGTPQPLGLLVEVTPMKPAKVRLGDVLFVRVSVKNRGKEPLEVPYACSLEQGTLTLRLYDEAQSTSFHFLPDKRSVAWKAPYVPVLRPGERRVLGREMVPVPRLDRIKWRFWNPRHWQPERYLWLIATCDGIFGCEQYILIDRRPDDEMAELLKWHEGAKKAHPRDGDSSRPTLATFGLTSFPPEASRPEKLAEMDIILSPGSLRDIVHVTRLTQAVQEGKGVVEKRRAAAKLFDWLEGRAEIEREWMLEQLYSWASGNKGLDEYQSELSEEIDSRLPAP